MKYSEALKVRHLACKLDKHNNHNHLLSERETKRYKLHKNNWCPQLSRLSQLPGGVTVAKSCLRRLDRNQRVRAKVLGGSLGVGGSEGARAEASS